MPYADNVKLPEKSLPLLFLQTTERKAKEAWSERRELSQLIKEFGFGKLFYLSKPFYHKTTLN